jgi:NAD(P)-dependent dehydrogenase (short-subunit alcohol dehydrogenase family)
MRDLKGATAFVTGAANGIGLGICRALARAGVTVCLADIESESLPAALEEIAALGPAPAGFQLDVSDPVAVREAAREAEARFGRVHILINNAGVSAGPAPIAEVAPDRWDWLFGVNVHGVLNGIRAFLPGMLTHGQPGHIVNTASIGGLQVNPVMRNGSYAATKYAVVALSEALRFDLEETAIGVSVFCPALVHTTLDRSGNRRPARYGGPLETRPEGGVGLAAITLVPPISTDEAGERVVHGIRENELFLLTHPEVRVWLEDRHQRLMAGFDSLARFKQQRGV